MLRKFFAEESGMETVEYAVFGSLLVAAGVAGATALWAAVQTKFEDIGTFISGPGAG